MRISIWLIFVIYFFPNIALSGNLNESHLNLNSKEAILRLDPQAFSKKYTQLQINELLRTLLNIRVIKNAQVYYDKKSDLYFFDVSFYERINSIKLSSTESSGKSWLKKLDLTEGDIFKQSEFKSAMKKLKYDLAASGFLNSKLSAKIKRTDEEKLDLLLHINPGPQTIVSSIKFKSSNLKLSSELEQLTKDLIGGPYSESVLVNIQEQTKEYFIKNGFYKTQLVQPKVRYDKEKTNVSISIQVRNPNAYAITFTGNDSFNRSELLKLLKLSEISSATPNLRPLIRQRLIKSYKEKGFNKVNVEVSSVKKSKPYQRTINFKISEGERFYIGKVNFQSNGTISKSELAEIWEDSKTEGLESNLFVESEISKTIENFVIFLQNKGYIRSRIKRFTPEQDPRRKSRINLFIELDEGPLTLIRSIVFEGPEAFTQSQLLSIIELSPNSALDLTQVSKSLERLEQFYDSQGYLEMKLTNKNSNIVTYSDDYTAADIVYKISEGPKLLVKNIVVEGTDITKDFVIKRELEFQNGSVLTSEKIRESTRRLQLLGHFSTIEITTVEKGTNISERTVIVKVKERDPGVFTLGAGANNELGLTFRGFIGLAYRNIDGVGRSISGRFQLKYNTRVEDIPNQTKLTVGFLEPYLFGTRVNGRVSAERSLEVDIVDDEITENNQLLFALEQNITSNFIVRYELLNIANVRDRSIDVNDANASDVKVNIATTGPVFDLDYRNHPFNTTRGVFGRLRFEYSHPELGSSDTIEFVRTTARLSHYYPLSKSERWILLNTIKAGSVQNISDRDDGGVPYDKKGFLIGGLSTLRGFEPAERFPNETDLNSENFLVTDWAQFALLRTEIQFPVYGNWKGGLFYDGGFVEISNLDFQDFYRDTVGLGILYQTPVGPFKLEIGKKLDRQDRITNSGTINEKDFVFHISIGNI